MIYDRSKKEPKGAFKKALIRHLSVFLNGKQPEIRDE
jgi:hypothetical protein